MKKLLLFSIAAISWAQAPIASPFATGTGGGGGSGTVTDVTISGTANQITVTGASCAGGTTSITCTLSIPSDFRLPGTINKLTLTQPATGSTLTITDGKTVVVNNTLTVQATDGTTVVFPAPASVTTGNCMEWTKSGSTLTLTDAGAPCAAGTGDAAATEAVASGATPTYTMSSNTLDTKTTAALATNIASCTIASATTGQSITWVITASGGTRTMACTDISGLGTLTIASGVTCTITARATSASTAAVKLVTCDGQPITLTGTSPGSQVTFPAGASVTVTTSQLAAGFGFVFGDPAGSALSAGSTTTVYLTVPYACTITGWDINVDAGTATVKFWRKATGTAIPTSSDSINTSGVSISTGTSVHSTTTSDFTSTAIAAFDILAANISTVATAKFLSTTLECQR